MPFFVNDENSPIYHPNAGIVRLDHQHQFTAKLVDGHEKHITKSLPTPIDHCKESFDDNASTLSTQSSEPRPRVNGDGSSLFAMHSVLNGKLTQLPDGMGSDLRKIDQNSVSKVNSSSGTPLDSRQPEMNGVTTRPNGPSRQGTSESSLRQGSMELPNGPSARQSLTGPSRS